MKATIKRTIILQIDTEVSDLAPYYIYYPNALTLEHLQQDMEKDLREKWSMPGRITAAKVEIIPDAKETAVSKEGVALFTETKQYGDVRLVTMPQIDTEGT